jgi:Family of unknown function (DUF6516)
MNMENLNTIFNGLLSKDYPGKTIDSFIKVIGSNYITEKPILLIELKNIEELLVMSKDCTQYFVLVDSGIFHLIAYYKQDDLFPLGRLYCLKEGNMFKFANIGVHLKSFGYYFLPIQHEEFDALMGISDYRSRVNNYKDRQSKDPIKNIYKGRKEATIIEEAFHFHSTVCLFCSNETQGYLITSSSTGFMLSVPVCDQHNKEAQNSDAFISYIVRKMGSVYPFKFIDVSQQELFEEALLKIKIELNCQVQKTENFTIHAMRSTGFKIVVRLTALRNYAYMIFTPQGKEICRIDSANHHAINFGPDHIHTNLLSDKKQVQPSFTFGNPLFDFKCLNTLLCMLETKYSNI